MEVLHMMLIMAASVLFLAGLSSTVELSPECKEKKQKCDNSYLVDANEMDGEKKILCSDMKSYTTCIHSTECGLTQSERLTIIDKAMDKFEGLICDYNSATRLCSISIMTVLVTAVLLFLTP